MKSFAYGQQDNTCRCGENHHFTVNCPPGKSSADRKLHYSDLDECSFKAYTLVVIRHNISAVEDTKFLIPLQLFTNMRVNNS